jgi:hypothetical protein
VSVTIEIPHHDPSRTVSRGVRDGRLERPIAIAQKDRDGVAPVILDGQVEVSVAGEIPGHHVTRSRYGIRDRGLERAVAVAREDRHVAWTGKPIGDGQIELAIAGEVAGHDR